MTSLAVAASQVTSHRSFCARATYVVIALTMVLVLPVTSLAQQPGGRIARDSCYSIPGEYGYEVHCDVAVMDLGASGYSYTAGQGIAPALSPDGTHLAFASESSVQITVVNLQTGSRDVVFNETGEWVGSPGWSFDRRIAFTRYRYALLPELWVMNADGTGLRQIAAAGFRGGPSWSPDGRIAFLCEIETGNLDICTVHADVTSFTRLTNSERDEAFPAFAPDGARIAFTDVGLLSILNADGSVINLGVRGGPATWSPDGTRLAFAIPWEGGCEADGRLCGYADIYWVNIDGSGLTLLTSGANPSWALPTGGLPPFAYFTAPCTALLCMLDASLSSDDGSIVAYEWKLGDGTAATGKTPAHTYATAGSFAVELTVIDDSGARTTSTRTLNVVEFATPIASFTVHCNGLFCAFDGSFSYDPDGIAVYTWSFGDGTSSFGSYTARRYVSAGTYPVTLSVRDNTGAIATKTTMVTVTNSRPTAAVQFSCDSLVCNFSGQGSLDLDGTIVSYAWTLGDGTQASGASAIHVFAGPGTYSVRLTVTDNMGDSGTADASVTVAQRFTHIGDLDAATNVQKRSWDAFVTLAIHDGAHQPAAYASVTGVWSNGSTASCTADHLGVCTVARHGLPNSTPSTTFTVQSVVSGAAIYSAAANHDSDGETNGTSVIVRKR